MKVEGRKNHGVRIMHALQTLSPVFYTQGMCHGKPTIRFKTSRRHEFTVLWHDLPFFPTCYKFQMLDAHFSRETKSALCLQFPLPLQVDQNFLPMNLWIYRVQSTYWSHHGDFPEYKERCTWSNQISRFKPQNDLESFSPATSIPKDVKGVIPLPTEKIRSNHTEPEVERLAQRKDSRSLTSPTIDTLEKGQAKEEKGS
jgi:hypothetical protein